MQLNYLVQPDSRLGDLLLEALATPLLPRRVVVVSAFVALQTVMRLKFPMLRMRDSGATVSVVFECALAKAGTAEHQAWQSYCTTPVRNSTRRFGYG